MPTREELRTPQRPNADSAPATSCPSCGAQEFRPRRRSFFNRVFSIVFFGCARCDYRQTRFRFSVLGLVIPLFLMLGAGGGYYVYRYRPAWPWASTEDSQLNTADALARARNSSGALSTFELMMLKKPKATMDNAAVIQLWKANVGLTVILQMIRNSNADYDVSPQSVIELKQAGVDQAVILAMIDATYNVR
jgi:hypothetical protein